MKKMTGLRITLFVWIAFFVFAMAMCIVLAMPKKAHAERQVFLKDGTLTVWVDVMKVDGIPKEITDAEVAFELVSGQLKEARIDGKVVTYRPSSGVQYVSPWKVTE